MFAAGMRSCKLLLLLVLDVFWEHQPDSWALKAYPMAMFSNIYASEELESKFREHLMAKNSAPNLICIGVAFLAALFYVVTGISDPSIDPKIDVRMVAMDFALLAIVALAQGQLWLNKKWAIGSPTMISVSLNTLAGLFLSTSYVFKFLARWTVNLNREALVSWMYRRAPTELVVTWDALMALHTVFYHKQLMIIWYFGLFRLLLIFIVFRDVFDWVQYEGALQLLVSMTYIFGLYQRDRRDRLSFAVATGKVKERGPSCTTSVVVESRFTLKALKAHLQSIWTSAFADTHKEENFQSYFATVSKKAVRLMSVAMMTSNVVSTTNLYFRFKGHRMADTDFIVHTVFAVTVPFICIFSFACTYMAAFGGKHLLRQQRTLTCAYALLRIGTTVLCICAVRCIPGYLDGTMNVYQVEGYEWHVYISILFFHYNAPVSLYGLDCLIGRYGLVCSGVDVVAGLLVAKWGNADGSPLLPITQLSMALFAGLVVVPAGERNRREFFHTVILSTPPEVKAAKAEKAGRQKMFKKSSISTPSIISATCILRDRAPSAEFVAEDGMKSDVSARSGTMEEEDEDVETGNRPVILENRAEAAVL